MSTKSVAGDTLHEQEVKYRIGIEESVAELATIRREMKKTDAAIRRLEVSTRRKLDRIRANLHVEEAV
jgi:hypothetical protein